MDREPHRSRTWWPRDERARARRAIAAPLIARIRMRTSPNSGAVAAPLDLAATGLINARNSAGNIDVFAWLSVACVGGL